MQPETFPHHQAAHDYARAHRLAYAWEGTPAFEERLHTLLPEQYQILAVHTQGQMTRVMLFARSLA
jgi:hypothetical protein